MTFMNENLSATDPVRFLAEKKVSKKKDCPHRAGPHKAGVSVAGNIATQAGHGGHIRLACQHRKPTGII